jgi:hypothetical protein
LLGCGILEKQEGLIKSGYNLPERKYQPITEVLRVPQILQFYRY